MRVKICGNRTEQDIQLAVQNGADAVGLIIGARHKTEDEISLDQGRRLLASVPVFVSSVLVTHLISAQEILDVYEQVPVSVIQLHDDIPLDQIELIRQTLPKVPLVKAVQVKNEGSLDIARALAPMVDAILLDTRIGDRIGGTGQVHDWTISHRIVEALDSRVFLAGGLRPDNLVAAIKQVQPFGVDVNSGVEFQNGEKDPEKVAAFVRLAKCSSAAIS